MQLTILPRKVLDFDIENRPLSYLGMDFTTSEVTAISWSWGIGKRVECVLLGIHSPAAMLERFVDAYNQADMVTGHYIRNHDLPIINGALAELGLDPLAPKMSSDTKNDLPTLKGISKSQENLCAMFGIRKPKIHMNQVDWRAANRLERLDLTRKRVVGDVRQHMELRRELLARGLLAPGKVWRP